MKPIRCYIPNVILTFLLVFLLLGCEALCFVRFQVMDPAVFRTVAEQESLADKAYDTLDKYFSLRSNSTGIPAEVFMEPMDKDALAAGISGSVEQALAYLQGRANAFSFSMDLTELDASIDAFFSDYADANTIARDAAYDEKVASVKAEARSKLLFVTDTFKLSVMEKNGWLTKAVPYVKLLDTGLLLCGSALILLLILLVLCNLRQAAHLLYWLGLTLSISGILALVPCIYVTAADYFTGFAIKDPQVFAAVVGLLNLLTERLTILEAAAAILGAVCLAAFGLLSVKKKKA